MERYIKNMSMLSMEENLKLKNYKVCVVGCGGLGGYIIEMLSRLGIGTITIVDGDVFNTSNLNRQLYCDENSLGKNKAIMAKERIKTVNSLIKINAFTEYLTKDNGEQILKGQDVIVDALDNIATRKLLQFYGEKLGIPYVHGAIAGWYGQVSTIFPGDKTLDIIYPNGQEKGLENKLGNPSFTPALVGSIQVSEVLKILIGRGELLQNKILYINLLNHEYSIIELKK
ncbi:MAG TPA: HesA/MoeB/ThiF family protein [Eubacteriaceae bacterium]|jgi:molybdopterin/thiamine biosynthesis adenylyltransferase|nr:HesA/MoeB/ThiF family protein [Eubacteriaceae bacterium]